MVHKKDNFLAIGFGVAMIGCCLVLSLTLAGSFLTVLGVFFKNNLTLILGIIVIVVVSASYIIHKEKVIFNN